MRLAENLKAPFIILSNGREHWFWNLERAAERDAYRIERLPSREDIERVCLKNLQPPRALGLEAVIGCSPRFVADDPVIRVRVKHPIMGRTRIERREAAHGVNGDRNARVFESTRKSGAELA